jgi:hypothetical protein
MSTSGRRKAFSRKAFGIPDPNASLHPWVKLYRAGGFAAALAA